MARPRPVRLVPLSHLLLFAVRAFRLSRSIGGMASSSGEPRLAYAFSDGKGSRTEMEQ